MITELEYQTMKEAYKRGSAWASLTGNDPNVSNAYLSQMGVFEFCRDKPAQYMAYRTGKDITTWIGDKLGTIIYSQSCRNNFAGRLDRIIVLGINGILYYGTSIGNNMYCRLTAYKNQEATKRKLNGRLIYFQ